MKNLKLILKGVLSVIAIILLSLSFFTGLFILISFTQTKLFLPKEYIMLIFKSPLSNLVFIYEYFIIFGFMYLFAKGLKPFKSWISNFKKGFANKDKKLMVSSFVVVNMVLLYTILYNVTIITDDKIIDYSFLSPGGNTYQYNDIVKIDTGIYGKKGYAHSKGEFYYIIELNDGVEINLMEIGGSGNDEDPRFIIEELDKQYVDMGIPKKSSMDNFEYAREYLDEIYTDKIKNILLNTN